tara:strand:+ start:1388 stop:1690 length:303 start_codon:yes stop_codon:yes gene_type:complete
MILKGQFKKLLQKETGTSKAGKQWEKQSFVIDTGADYNAEICISTFGDQIDTIQNIKEGTQVEVSVNISSKEFNGKYYHNISSWKIEIQNQNVETNDMPF